MNVLRPLARACAALALVMTSPLAARTEPHPAEPVGVALPAWIAGTWAMQQGAQWADEVWLAPRGDSMIGMARAGFGPDVESWESIRIVRRAGSLVLLAQPKGAAAIEFPLAFASAEAIEFANTANSFPQRIRYARAGQLLTIEQSRIDGSDAVWTNYRPVQTGE